MRHSIGCDCKINQKFSCTYSLFLLELEMRISIPGRSRSGSLSETVRSRMHNHTSRPNSNQGSNDLPPENDKRNDNNNEAEDGFYPIDLTSSGVMPLDQLEPNLSSRSAFPTSPDVNVYQQKKTLAQGMMDLALLSANANQFRYVLQTNGSHAYYYPSLVMIGASLFLQITVGIGLIWNSRYNVKVYAQMCKANTANNWTVMGIFLITILNVFITSFGIGDDNASQLTS